MYTRKYAWHSLDTNEILKILKTDPLRGLSKKEAKLRLKEYGENKIIEKKTNTLAIFISQFTSPLILILIVASFITALLSYLIDFSVIVAIVIINSIIGFFNEYKAEKAIERLKEEMPVYAKVIRDGTLQRISASQVVPGDIVVIEAGDKIVADARVIESYDLKTNDAILTGESIAQLKFPHALPKETNFADRHNMVWQSTTAVYGKAKAVVVATGMKSKYGKIAKAITEKASKTPLQIQLSKIAKKLTLFVIFLTLIFFIIGFLQGFGFFHTFLTAISLAVAIVPEGLPAIVTIALSIGMIRLKKVNIFTKKLPAAEGLGSVTTICVDKTGTITRGEMTAKKIYIDSNIYDVSGIGFNDKGEISRLGAKVEKKEIEKNKTFLFLLKDCFYCNNADVKNLIGDPTELALAFLVKKAKQEFNGERLKEFPFSSERKMMSVLVKEGTKKYVFSKGAPEKILERCTKQTIKATDSYKEKILSEVDKKKVMDIYNNFAKKGYRVLAFAFKEYRGIISKQNVEKNLTFLGLIAIYDPPKENIRKTISKAKNFGINFYMITGDAPLTAKTIAREIGLEGKVMEGKQLDTIKTEDLAKLLDEYRIFARVNPEHKVKILKALKAKGEVVAMFGDGINDAPALKKADIGVSMNIKATGVTKEVADIIIVNDDLASMIEGIKEGRKIKRNISKFINYLLSCNIAEALVVFIAALFKQIALLPAQILWINLITDGLPAVSLANDPVNEKIITKQQKILSKKLYLKITINGLILTFLLTLLYFLSLKNYDKNTATTLLFTGFVFFELVRLLSIKVNEESLFNNKFLNMSIVGSILLQLIILYTPLNKAFKVVSPSLAHLIILVILLIFGFLLALISSKIIEKYVKD